ncbi:hypothetical protein SEPMUDRAFT_150952 [Lecanosticta acicola]|uniref:Uncharacterized protein n=1 Tax=Lecanosticta acicola TaxID=111012 RepID=A0AAI9EAJ0_9PEZI|nr:hypothetical protein SEPMUDRAFT_150952 [Lecanosticta acicola]
MYFTVYIILPSEPNVATRSTANSNKPENAWTSISVPYKSGQTLDDLVHAADERVASKLGSGVLAGYDCGQVQDAWGTEMVLSDKVGDLFEPTAPQVERQLYMHLHLKTIPATASQPDSSGALPDVYDIEAIDDDEEDGYVRIDRQGFKIPPIPTKLPQKRPSPVVLVNSSSPEEAPPAKRVRENPQAPTPPTSSPRNAFSFLNGAQAPHKKAENWSREEDELLMQGIKENLSARRMNEALMPSRSAGAIRGRKTYLKRKLEQQRNTERLRTDSVSVSPTQSSQETRDRPHKKTSTDRDKSPVVLIDRGSNTDHNTSRDHLIPSTNESGSRAAAVKDTPRDHVDSLLSAKGPGQALGDLPLPPEGRVAAGPATKVEARPKSHKRTLVKAPASKAAPPLVRKIDRTRRSEPNKTLIHQPVPLSDHTSARSTSNGNTELPGNKTSQPVPNKPEKDFEASPTHRETNGSGSPNYAHKEPKQFYKNITPSDRYDVAREIVGDNPLRIRREMEDLEANEKMLNAVLRQDQPEIDRINAMKQYRTSQRAVEDGQEPPTLHNRLRGLTVLKTSVVHEEADEEFGPENDFGAQLEEERARASLSPMRAAFMEESSQSEHYSSDTESMIHDREIVEVEDEPSVTAHCRAPPAPARQAHGSKKAACTEKKRAARLTRRSRAADRRRSSMSVSSKMSVSRADTSSVADAGDARISDQGRTPGQWGMLLSDATFPVSAHEASSRREKRMESEEIVYGVSGDETDA